MSYPISIQLYTVRDLCKEDFFGVIRKIAQIGYSGVEYAGFHGKTAAEVAALVGELGLKSSSAHISMPTPQNIDQLAGDARALGYTDIITGFGPDDFATLDKTKAAAERFARGVEVARSAGLTLGMHNHWFEFDKQFDGKTPYEIVMGAVPNLFSELDIYWCAKAGCDAAAVTRRWAKRIPLLHVKDGDLGTAGVHKAVGDGKVPVRDIINAADPATLRWLVVELDNCATDMMEAVTRSYRWLAGSGLGTGRA